MGLHSPSRKAPERPAHLTNFCKLFNSRSKAATQLRGEGESNEWENFTFCLPWGDWGQPRGISPTKNETALGAWGRGYRGTQSYQIVTNRQSSTTFSTQSIS